VRARQAGGSGAGRGAAVRLARVLRHVTSQDGVRIACEVSGEGTPLVLVHGAGSARWSFDLVRPELESRFTVIAIDRRGRGDSTDGDGAGYEVKREFEDVAAVVRDAGDGALLVGHSYGALIAAGAAQLLDGLPRLVLYEPPMGGVLGDAELIDRWERLIAADDRDPMLREFFSRVAGYSEDEIDELARSPVWERRKQVSPTLPRELRAELAFMLDPAALARLATPTLMLLGSESPDWARLSTHGYSEAIPNVEVRMLEGHGHGANTSGPELLAAEIARFLSGPL
jgi:pimeloyl-ACP methyl ester carboxylesterase